MCLGCCKDIFVKQNDAERACGLQRKGGTTEPGSLRLPTKWVRVKTASEREARREVVSNNANANLLARCITSPSSYPSYTDSPAWPHIIMVLNET